MIVPSCGFFLGLLASERNPDLNLVAELSSVRSGLTFLLCLAMFSTLLFIGMDVTLPCKILDMKHHSVTNASHDPNASVNDTNMVDILSHESDVAISDQEESFSHFLISSICWKRFSA